MQILTKLQKGEKKLREFIEEEFSNYSFNWKIVPDDDYNFEKNELVRFDLYYRLEMMGEPTLALLFEYDESRDMLILDMCDGEGPREEIEPHTYSVRYFWMKVSWE